jgi:hypothetical protein
VARTDLPEIYIFGGIVRDGSGERLSSQLDIVSVGRGGLTAFGPLTPRQYPGADSGAARRQAVLAAAGGVVVAFGGLGGAPEGPLDSFVMLDPGGQPAKPVYQEVQLVSGGPIIPLRMSAPRVGHTASTVPTTKARPQQLILVFGGAPAGGSVADLVDPKMPHMLVPWPTPLPAGAGRRDHAVVEVTVGNDAH